MARPSKFNETILKQAQKLAAKGFTDKELAAFFDVDEKTINNWKIAHPQFFQSIKENKEAADARVERSLYERALGYSHPSEKILTTKLGDVIRVPTTEHYPPDPTSIIFWLTNRQPDKWRRDASGGLSVNANEVKIIKVGRDSDRDKSGDG